MSHRNDAIASMGMIQSMCGIEGNGEMVVDVDCSSKQR